MRTLQQSFERPRKTTSHGSRALFANTPSRRTKHHRPVNPGLAVGIGGVGGAEVGEQGVHEVGAVAGAGEPALHGAFR